ncbi:hypothetical protein TVAG_358330 [Trichomonas vaginalis G3]|uniref:Uncharacterized protein n=1 Tax=Trichomonas vaginalis (strain ATCC PRA-98 / G3) TaxID=412133 RepID=A2ELE1_TRIV3|nr:transforming growth factor beta regulated gene 1 family protein [Trichomonas vaginalis G3]EAY06543.1 hypothetical protein TVAG_358330 [Trichomonas vaginalis G3]KAI5526112.1 transforming growth factor beta regulated gene 1 family protein [Trichomonas vaginalis G3]|eukprot:XP_001318766.1 hypothetical protein [Trichomonas vaginalis G3]
MRRFHRFREDSNDGSDNHNIDSDLETTNKQDNDSNDFENQYSDQESAKTSDNKTKRTAKIEKDETNSDPQTEMSGKSKKKSKALKSRYEEGSDSSHENESSNSHEDANDDEVEEEEIEKEEDNEQSENIDEESPQEYDDNDSDSAYGEETDEKSSKTEKSDSGSEEQSSSKTSSENESQTYSDKIQSSDDQDNEEDNIDSEKYSNESSSNDSEVENEVVNLDGIDFYKEYEQMKTNFAEFDKDRIGTLNPTPFLPFSGGKLKTFKKQQIKRENSIYDQVDEIYNKLREQNEQETKHEPVTEQNESEKSQTSEESEESTSSTSEEHKKPFIYPPIHIHTSFDVVGKEILTDNEECSIIELTNLWAYAQNSVCVVKPLDRKVYMICSLIATFKKLYKNINPILLITDEVSQRQWITNLNRFGDFNIQVLKTKTSEMNKKDFDILLMSKPLVLRYVEWLPQNIKFSMVLIEDFSDPRANYITTLRDKVKTIRSNWRLMFCKNLEEYSSRYLQIMLSTLRNRGNDSYTKQSLFEAMNSYSICPDKLIYNKDNIFKIREEVMYCPMTEYQIDINKKVLKSVRQKLKSKNEMKKSELILSCSSLYSICSHPVFESDHVMDDDVYTAQSRHQSGKLIFLWRFLRSDEVYQQRIIVFCEDDDSVTLINSCFADKHIPFMRVDSETSEKDLNRMPKLFLDKIPLVVCTEEKINWCLNNLKPTLLIPFDIFWRPTKNNLELLKKNNLKPRFLRLITKNSIDEDIFAITSQSDELTGDDLLTEETANPEILDKLLRKQIIRESKLQKVTGDIWWRGILSTKVVSIYGQKETFPSFDDSDIKSPDFWQKILYEEHKKKSAENLKISINSPQFIVLAFENMRDFGYGRYDTFKRPKENAEIRKICQNILSKMDVQIDTSHSKFLLSISLRASSSHPVVTAQQVVQAIGDFPVEEFLNDFETSSVIKYWIENDFDNYIPLPEETEFDDKELVKNAYDNGLRSLPNDQLFHLRNLVNFNYKNIIPPHPDKNLQFYRKKITPVEHKKIMNNLLKFGYPGINDFLRFSNLQQFHPDLVEQYVQTTIKYVKCYDPEERKRISEKFVDKVKPYILQSLASKLSWFEEIRKGCEDYERVTCEDMEILKAFSFHGPTQSIISPTFMSFFKGSPSESKVLYKIKQMQGELYTKLSRHVQTSHKNLDKIKSELPFRLSDQIMLENLGEIDSRETFHTKDAVYLVGYKVRVITLNPFRPDLLIPVEASIECRNGRPVFLVKVTNCGWNYELIGADPNSVWELFKLKCTKHTKLPVYEFYGDEMFGFLTPNYHRIVSTMLTEKDCKLYIRRVFRDINIRYDKRKIVAGEYSWSNYVSAKEQNKAKTMDKAELERKRTEQMCAMRLDLAPLKIDEDLIELKSTSSTLNSLFELYEDSIMDEVTPV